MGGFYGNITNTSKTQFQFDKIYPNRKTMEKSIAADNIYLGRYVLVEYSKNNLEDYIRVYSDANKLYQDSNHTILLTTKNTTNNQIVYEELINNNNKPYHIFYQIKHDDSILTYDVIIENDGGSNDYYTTNYFIDTNAYEKGRGYDSTVWQKVYSDGIEKYVNIAELNTVIPTFDISPDAPTMNPVAPHFDINNTNVYYKLHWQAPWGFRVGQAQKQSLSDVKTKWTETVYNPKEGINETTQPKEVNAAIYFNKAAFDKQLNPEEPKFLKKHDDTTDNEIKVCPVSSGKAIYNDHNNPGGDKVAADDIQEMTINLPAIGNMMSDAWDIIYGPNRDSYAGDGENGSLQGRLNSFNELARNKIPITRKDNGAIVGTTINGDKKAKVSDILKETISISNEQDDAWIRTDVNGDYEENSISIHHTFTPTDDTTSNSNVNGNGDTIELDTPIVDKAGHVVGKNTETVTLPYSFKTIKTNGQSVSVENGNLKADAIEDITAKNTQDTLEINVGNSWLHSATSPSQNKIALAHTVNDINVEPADSTNLNGAGDVINIPDWAYDKAGHITEKHNHTYTLPYGFKTIETNGRSADETENATSVPTTENVVADNTQDILTINSGNKWIRIDTDTSKDAIAISHDVHETTSTTSTKTLVSETEVTTFDVPTYTFDKAGHYTSHDTKTITMPFGYGKVKGDTGNTSATATFDELIFKSDDWLTATVTKDAVTYSHDYPNKVDDTESTFNVNGNGDTIVLETLTRDSTGHVTKVNQNTVTLPFGYKTFKDSNNEVGESVASNTQDTFVFKGDNWIKPTVSNDLATFEHIGPVSHTYTSKTNVEPKFGDTFIIEDLYYDNKGHIFNTEEHTVKIPQGSLTDDKATGADVITQLSFVGATGALSTERTNISELTLTGYSKKANGDDIAAGDALGDALSKLQTQIHNYEIEFEEAIGAEQQAREHQDDFCLRAIAAEEQARTTQANELKSAIDDEGKRAKQAEANLDARINALLGDGTLNEAFDTIKEISDWLGENDSGADKIIDDIAILNGDNTVEGSVAHSIKVAIDQEIVDRSAAIAVEKEAREKSIVAEIDRASAAEKELSDTIATYGDIVTHNINEFATVEDKDNISQDIITVNSRCNVLDNEVKNLINKTNSYGDIVTHDVEEFAMAEDLNSVNEQLQGFVLKDAYNSKMAELDAAIIGINQEAKRLTNENIAFAQQLDSKITAVDYNKKIAELDAAIIGINQEAKRLTNENIALMEIIQNLTARLEALENQN